MKLHLSADELLTTTRQVRRRLDLDRPVERAVVEEALEIALQAPTGGNRQSWHWVVVEDAKMKAAIADVYRANFDAQYRSAPPRSYPPGDSRRERQAAVRRSVEHLADSFHRVPLMVIPCITGRLDHLDVGEAAGAWGSLLPAVWSLMLALRERGVGSALTTLHLKHGGERRVADIVGIPYDEVTQGGLLAVAYTKGTEFKPARREPLSSVLHWGAW